MAGGEFLEQGQRGALAALEEIGAGLGEDAVEMQQVK
jgi:hypothetical protein